MTHNPVLDRLRSWLTSANPAVALGVAVGVAVGAGLVVGALFGWLGPLLALGGVGVLVVGTTMLRSTEWGLLAMLTLICLLPYAALPIEIGFRPTFLDLALLAVFGVWLMRIVSRAQRVFDVSALGMPIFAFLVWMLVTFVAGLAHAPLSATVLRRFAEVLLAIVLCLVVINQVRRLEQIRRVTTALIVAGGLSGAVGVLFYVLPGDWTVAILSRLAVFNYPAGGSILRYVEDDPNQPMRAIGTSIDPNALGGLMVIVVAVALVQLFASRPSMPRRWLVLPTGAMVLCLLLTFSRGSMIGLAVGVAIVGVLRYRRLLVALAVLAVLLLILPPTQVYVARLIEGFQGQDLATQMRFGEYKDALILIGRYPVLGVGFSGTPDIDLYLGVSMLYLLIAEQVGLVGLFLFLVVMATFFAIVLRALRHIPPGDEREGYLLAYTAALGGALAGGVFDHFFFNINFIHLVALFWVVVGLGVASASLSATDVSGRPVEPAHRPTRRS
jgi:O-antigen ligase